MPQLDFFFWFSVAFGTILLFQFLYYFLLYYIMAPLAIVQKTVIKLYASREKNFVKKFFAKRFLISYTPSKFKIKRIRNTMKIRIKLRPFKIAGRGLKI